MYKVKNLFVFSAIVACILTAGLLNAESGSEEITVLQYSVRAESAERLTDELGAYATQKGGYLSAMRNGYAEYKIPVRTGRENIEKKIASVPGVSIYSQSRQSSDVTGQIVDKKAKLKVASANLSKLRQLSSQAGLDDLLDLETALSRSLEEVEELKGEIRYLEESASLYHVRIQMNQTGSQSDSATVPIPWIRRLTLEKVLESR